MKNAASVCVFIVFSFSTLAAFAQQGVCTEQAIRSQGTNAQMTDDVYVYSGALDKPAIGKQEVEKTRDLPVFRARKNVKSGPGHVDRVVVSPSGDMAYEYGTGSLAFDDADTGKRHSFDIAYLRVWRSVDGQCKVAAVMHQPEGSGGTRGTR